ncbi:MAG: PAS domain S-box protein, partial [Cyanobacteria bacterium J06639_14]
MTAVTSSSLINNASLRSLGEESRLSAELQMTPLTVCKQTPLSEVVALMSRDRQICNLTCDVIPSTFATRPSQEYSPERSSLVLSCVVVIEDGKPIGIFTGRDLVRLAATGRTIGNQTIEDVMTRSPITITQEQATNLFTVVTILQEHRIRHLVVVNAVGKLVGLLTHEGIRQSLQPSDLLRLQSVAESLTRDVTQATATTTLQAIAQLMTQYQVSCVVITETIQGKTRPLGIITEGDIVQYQSLQLDFAQLAAQIVMSHPVFCATPNLNLWQAHQLMLEHRITHLVITHADGALAGILPQTTILKSLNPAEMFEVIGILQEQVERLEAEKLELLESRNVELQQAVNLKTADLAQQNEFERLLVDINNRIRSSLNFDTVLATAVETLQEALQVDRALVYRFHPDWSGRVVIESVSATQWSLLNQELGNSCFQHPAAEKYRHKPVRAITNIYDANLQDCYVEFLEQLDVKSHVVAAIWHDEQLWGLLVLHNCRAIRHWHDREIELVRKVSDQLTIALRQANTHESLQSELAARQQAEIRLRESEQRYASLAAVVPVVIFRANISGACIYINEYWTTLTGMSREDALSQGWTQVIHPEDREDVMIAWQKAIQTGKRFQLEYRLQLPNGPIKWVYEQAEPEWDVTGKICGYVGSLIDISDRKQAELALRESEQRFRRAIAEAPVPIMIHAEDGEILQISSTWTDLTGYSHADIPTIQAWTKRAYGEKATSIVANVIAQQYSLQSRCEEGEFLINTANGLKRIWSFSSASLGKLPDGRRIAIAMAADVTEQQKAKVALQASESRYRALVEVIPDLMIRQDAEGNYLDLVMSDEIRFIKPDSAHIGINVYNLLPLELAQQRMAYVHRALQTGEVQIYDFEIDIEGDRRWQESRILAINQTEVLVIVRDISQRKQTELALRESEQRFRRAIADAPFPIMIHAEDGEVLQINSTWTNLTGYTQSDIPTLQTWAELTYNDQADSMIAKTLTKNCGLNSRWEECELTIKTSKGGTRIWSLSSAPLGSLPDGRQIAVSMAADITERQQTQAALQASESRYRALVEVIPDLMIRQDSQGNYLDLVTSSEIQLVRPDRTHIGNNIYELMPLELAEQRMAYIHQALQTGEVQIYEFQIEIAGELRWEEARVIAINKSEVLVIVRDINERKQAEAQLQSTSQRLQEAQRIAHLGNWELNIQTNHLYWSDEVFRIFAIDQNQFGASYEAFIEAIHPDDREMVNQAYQQHVQDGIPYNIVHRLLMPDGRIKYVQEQGETLQDVDGTAILSRGTVLDITTLKDAEQKRQEAEASLRQIVEGTAAVTECDFFQELVQHIAAALDVRYTSISEATSDGFAILAFCADGQLQRVDDCLYNQVPCCLQALQDGQCCHPDSLPNLYPDNELFSALNAESYLGIGLRNSTGEPIGNLCTMHDRPLHNPEGIINLLKIFGARAGAELERYQTARQLQKLTTELEQRV